MAARSSAQVSVFPQRVERDLGVAFGLETASMSSMFDGFAR
jgi:hypothetical protein